MAIIAITNQKGGSTKSTIAIHLAYWLAAKKRKSVHLVDADPQRSSTKWTNLLENPFPVTELTTADDLLEQVPELAEQVDFLVIDSPPSTSEIARTILYCADLAVIPCVPSPLDMDAAADTVRLVRQARTVRKKEGELPKAAFLISNAKRGTRLEKEAIALINQIPDLVALKTIIHQKQVVADAFGQNVTVFDMKGKGVSEAIEEFESAFKEIMRLLK
ncbi:ParA family partition ATPase [Scytonema sp. NUACC21]